MYKIIGADKKEYGPISAEQIRQWIRDGRANAQTSGMEEGENEWKPLGNFPEFAAELDSSGGAASPSNPAAAITVPREESYAGSGGRIAIGSCLEGGWELLKANLWLLVLAAFLVFAIGVGCSMIPIVGSIASLVISGPLYGGLYTLYLKRIRDESATVGDIFDGFSEDFVPLMLTFIVVTLLTMISSFVAILAVVLGATHILEIPAAIILGLVGLVPPVYLMVAWVFAIPLVIDKKMEFWPAMELSRRRVTAQWWRVFGLFVVGSLITMAGAMVCFVGMFFTMPIFLGAMMIAYEEIFGTANTASD
ncbi:MAG: GYF domain-containing protein [Candidatus Omnitrophica bacterium]|nr:GYF domain-containing protein [Candidatus Omnitrophota bacterium]